jgi:hypothetical protein
MDDNSAAVPSRKDSAEGRHMSAVDMFAVSLRLEEVGLSGDHHRTVKPAITAVRGITLNDMAALLKRLEQQFLERQRIDLAKVRPGPHPKCSRYRVPSIKAGSRNDSRI